MKSQTSWASRTRAPEVCRGLSATCAQGGAAGIGGAGAQLFFDAQKLIVLRRAVRARQRAGLDLPAIGGDGEIGDGRSPRSRRNGAT